MAIATTNPATGEVVKAFDADDRSPRSKSASQRGRVAASRCCARTSLRPAGGLDAGRRRHPRRRSRRRSPRTMTIEMGKTLATAKARGRASARRAAATTPSTPRSSWPTRPSTRPRSSATDGLRALPAARPGARRHAVELPAVAGDALRRTGADGRQRRAAQARLQRAADRRCSWRTCSGGPASPTARSRRCSSARTQVERVLADRRVGPRP